MKNNSTINKNDFNYLQTNSSKVVIIAGENGAGKSRYLRDIALNFSRGGDPVTIVCNTIYDRYTGLRNVAKISASQGKKIAEKALKNCVIEATNKNSLSELRSIENVLRYCGYSPKIGFKILGISNDAINNLADDPDFMDNKAFESADVIKYLYGISYERKKDDIEWISTDRYDQRHNFLGFYILGAFFKVERLLKKHKVFKSIKFYLEKNETAIPLSEGSSGELTLISSLLYLSTYVPPRSIILIDEPENSLHPLWQREYVTKLLDVLYLVQPTIVIATHSPIIVSAALIKEENKSQVETEIYQIKNDSLIKIEDSESDSSSVEETYWNAFNTVTPVNHYVSETLATTLQKLNEGEITLAAVKKLIHQMDEASYDPLQKKFFKAAEELAIKVSEQVNKDDETSVTKSPNDDT